MVAWENLCPDNSLESGRTGGKDNLLPHWFTENEGKEIDL